MITVLNYLKITKRDLLIAAIITLVALISITHFVSGSVGLGGLVSELMVGRSGVTNSRLVVSTDGEGSPAVVGLAGVVTTGTADNFDLATSSIDLHGTVTSMNGMPVSTVYFNYGYSQSSLGNTTTTDTVTGTGNYDITLTGIDTTQILYYQASIDADGTNTGSVLSYSQGRSVGYQVARTLISLGVALVIIVAALMTRNPVMMLGGVMLGIIAFYAVQIMLNM